MSGGPQQAETAPTPSEIDGARAAVDAAVKSYNDGRQDAQSRAARDAALYLTPLVAAALAFIWLAGPALWNSSGSFVLFAVLAGSAYAGQALWKLAPVAQARKAALRQILPSVFGFIDGFHHSRGAQPGFMEYLPAHAVPHDRIVYDDMIAGLSDGMRFGLVEAEFWRDYGDEGSRVFKGVVFHCLMQEPFNGVLTASKKLPVIDRAINRAFGSGPELAPCANKRLDAMYEFRSDNSARAASLVDGPLTSVLLSLGQNWPEDLARVALDGKNLFLLLPTKRDYLALPDITEELDFHHSIEPMIPHVRALINTGRFVRDALS